MKIKESRGDRVLGGIIVFILCLFALLCLYPLWLVLINSFSDPSLVATGKVWILPKGFTLDAYIEAFSNGSILRGYANSLFYTVVGTALNMALTIPAAYALSKPELAGGKGIMKLFIFTMYFSGGLVPSFILLKKLGMLDTYWAVLFTGALSVYNLIVARTFFANGVLHELEEAAEIDGCSTVQTFFKIVLPLSKAMIGVIFLYYAVARWNNYTSALYYLPTNSSAYPLQMVIRNMLAQANNSAFTENPEVAAYYAQLYEQLKYAVIVIASAPLLAVFPFIQKYFEKGVMLGSVKG
jgi:putative aldouronate transport system permease protein